MFLLRRPSPHAIVRFLDASTALPLSYDPVGIVSSATRRLDSARAVLGHGPNAFRQACEALRTWRQFNVGWVETFPGGAPIEAGTVVAVLIRHLGFWSLNGCRIVYVQEERDRFGFAYGTLTNHAESGEELFQVSIDASSGAVRYEIRATSRPQAPLAWVGHPIARALQARFRSDSIAAMQAAVGR